MGLKNYTSQVPASRSIAWIEAKLANCGARQILKMFDDESRVEGIAFILPIDGVGMSFKLPAQIDACERVLKASVRRPTAETDRRVAAQAERTAWKIVADWVGSQMAMIELSQVEFMQVWMPYLYSHSKQRTYYELMKDNGLRNLLPEAVTDDSEK